MTRSAAKKGAARGAKKSAGKKSTAKKSSAKKATRGRKQSPVARVKRVATGIVEQGKQLAEGGMSAVTGFFEEKF
ncbi:MAG TPA: hypothetical protein VGT98_03495 [Candidatus Elarobacter sp.]|nr:hypothetical protein [Candidatus Elarobacter sp.]